MVQERDHIPLEVYGEIDIPPKLPSSVALDNKNPSRISAFPGSVVITIDTEMPHSMYGRPWYKDEESIMSTEWKSILRLISRGFCALE